MSDGNRYVVSPPPSTVTSLTLQILVAHFVLRDARFNNNGRGIRAGARLLDVFKDEKPFYKVHPDDWALLTKVAEEPGQECGYPLGYRDTPQGRIEAHLGGVLIPLLDAIKDAKTEPPPPPPAEEPAPAAV